MVELENPEVKQDLKGQKSQRELQSDDAILYNYFATQYLLHGKTKQDQI